MTQHGVTRDLRPDDNWLNPAQAAAYLGIAVSTLAKWRVAGSGPPFHRPRPRIVRYLRSELDAWFGGQHGSTGGAAPQGPL